MSKLRRERPTRPTTEGVDPAPARAAQARLLDLAHDALIVRDPASRIVSWSAGAEAAYGWSAEEAIGQITHQLLRTVFPTSLAAIDARLAAEGNWSGELVHTTRDGRVITVDSRQSVDRGPDGAVTRILEVNRDVTAERAARQALADSEARLRATLDALAAGVVVQDPSGRIVSANPAACRILGLEIDEITGRTSFDARWEATREDGSPFPGDQHPAMVALRTGIPQRDVVMGVGLPDGQRTWITISDELLRDEAGEIAGVVVSFVDITSRKEAELALAASEERFRLIAENASDVVVRASPHGVIEWVSPSSVALLGWTPDELVGQTVQDLIHPDDAPAFAAAQSALAAGSPVHIEARVRRRSGTFAWIGASIRPLLGPAGTVIGRVGSWRATDTEHAARDALAIRTADLEEAQRLAHVGSWTWDPATDRPEWSAEMYRIFGLDPNADTIGMATLGRFVDRADLADIERLVSRTLKTGEPYRIDYDIHRPDGERRRAATHGEAVRDASGAIIGVRGTVADVTEARTAETERLEAVGRLAAGVAHDLNNALMAINGVAELLQDSLDADDPRRQDVAAILTAGQRAAALGRQLQAFGRRQTLRPVRVDLASLVRDAAPGLRSSLGSAVALVLEVSDPPPTVLVDPGQVELVLRTLVANAREAMPDRGTITLAVSSTTASAQVAAAHRGVRPGPFGRLSVSDTGPALAPEELEHVFEPFYSSRELGRGSGLGLATVEGIASQSGGWVEAESIPGRGSTFSVLLPGVAEEAVGRLAPTASKAVPARVVLVVDDEEIVRRAMARLLRTGGWTVVEAAGPEEALAVSEATLRGLDAVVTDVVMPAMDGGQLSDQLRARRPGLPVVFVSGYAPDASLRERLALPATTFLAKPFGRDAFKQAIESVIGGAIEPR